MRTLRRLTTVSGIRDPYARRILSNIVGRDPFKVYSATPSRLKHLVRRLTVRQLHTPPGKKRWSIAQIITHLYDSEVVMAFRFRMAVAQSGAKLQPFDQDKWAENLKYDKVNVREKLNSFIMLRRDHVRFLNALSSREWKRYGMHEERGKETVERMVQLEAGHDLNHLQQISAIRELLLKKTG